MLNNLHFFQILQNAVTILLFSINSAVYLLSKVCWFYSLNSFLQFKTNKYSLLTGGTFPSSKDDFVLVVRTVYARTQLGSKKIFRFKIVAFLSPIGLRPLSYDFVFQRCTN